MSFIHQTEDDQGINEINMTPLVDVMLVLLVIFIVTIPVVKQAIEIDLPDAVSKIRHRLSKQSKLQYTQMVIYFLMESLCNPAS